jgi:hypothetical protein
MALHASHSCSVIAIASLSLALADFAAGNRRSACLARSREREWIAMTRRRAVCAFLFAAAVLAGTLLIANALQATAIQTKNKNDLTLAKVDGMTKEELVRIVGPPDNSDHNTCTYRLHDRGKTLVVCFDEAGKVCSVMGYRFGPPFTRPTLTERIRRWFDRFGM